MNFMGTLEKTLRFALAILMTAMVASVVWQVLSRYLFVVPAAWTIRTPSSAASSAVAASSCTLASKAILRRRLGARVIQLPSGNIPTISEWACCEIIRTSCLR